MEKGVEGGLAPCGPAGLRHDRGDGVDQLREAGDFHPVSVLQEGDHEAPDHEGILERVDIFQDRRGHRPRRHRLVGRESMEPNVPLVEGEVQRLLRALFCTGQVAGGDYRLDLLVHTQ